MKRALQALVTLGVLLVSLRLSGAETFRHPGLLQSREDLARMKKAVEAKEEPVFSGYQVFRASPASQSTYQMRGPRAMVSRNPTVGASEYDADANAAYQCALMWSLTGDIAYANKARKIVNAWSQTLQSITGRDAVLMAGLGPFKMVNAAELLRYTDAGWSPVEVERTEKHFREVVYPVIKDFAPFANGNWDAAAVKTMMAIGVFCNDRPIFERALRYYVNGAGDGRLAHYIINQTGQCQESGRDQQHTQLGLAHLGDCCEIAWHQGLDLYGYEDNLLLKGFEYTAKYNLGEDVPFAETLDRTGKYHHRKLSPEGRGRFRAVYEEIYNHYVNRAGLAAPYTERVVERICPEGAGMPGADHVGFGTLLFARRALSGGTPVRAVPVSPAGIVAEGSATGNQLTWVAAVGARTYTIKREQGSTYQIIDRDVATTHYTDRAVNPGETYRYVICAVNAAGESSDSAPVSICAGMPLGWSQQDMGPVAVAGKATSDRDLLTLEGAGRDIGGTNDQCHFVFRPFAGDCALVARFVPQPSSQFSRFGWMMREGSVASAANVSFLIGAEASGEVEAPGWQARLASRRSAGAGMTVCCTSGKLAEPTVTQGRLVGPCWLKLERSNDTFTASISSDGGTWTPVGATTVALPEKLNVGLAVCSGLTGLTTRVMFDHVTVSKAGNSGTAGGREPR